ncbi:FAST kinase domain-containing protein 2, mitochondrial [Tiliqua scincoides]|uniref:FAST kinase domain-containing protein 2, mitochondrial n=1 Tax=Tiliqua scincoides TaxID=71010 RepID=UPI003462F1C1
MLSSKMHKKLDCFIRSVRQWQVYHYAPRPFFRPAVRTFALGINEHKNTAQHFNLRQLLLSESPCWCQPSVRFFSQDTLIINAEDASVSEQKTANVRLVDCAQGPGSTAVKSTHSPSGFSVSSKEDRSAVEDGRSKSKQFFEDLQKCISPCDVLDLTSKNPLSQKYPSNCFATMWMLTKKLSEDQRHYERQLMFQHPQFSQLCQVVMHEAKYMWRDDLVYSLLAVVKLGVPQNTRLVQTLLRVCQERLNEFDDRCLSVIATTLQGMETCKNVEALQVGLQLLVEQRIPKISNVFMLQTMMKCIGKDAPLTLKTKVENKILSQLDQFTVPNAQHMFSVLAEMNHRSLPILNACSNKVIENIQGIPFWRLLTILRSCKDLMYRNSALYSALADYAASTFYMWDTKQVVLFLSAFENLGFRPVDLMDIFAEKVIAHPTPLNVKDIVAVLRAYSLLNHTPKDQNALFLETLNSALNKHLSRISNVDLLKAVYSFCILGYLPQPALDQLMQDEILHDLLASGRQNTEQNEMMLRAVNACLELDGHSSTKPTALSLENPLTSPVFHLPDVQEVLLTLLGDRSLFQSNVQLAHGYSLDFEILMDADRRTVVPDTVADQSTDDSHIQRLAVLCAPVSAFCVGSRHPRGRLAMKMRHLQLLGYHVILVHYQEFQKLKKEEAVEFLKREIFSEDAHPGSN